MAVISGAGAYGVLRRCTLNLWVYSATSGLMAVGAGITAGELAMVTTRDDGIGAVVRVTTTLLAVIVAGLRFAGFRARLATRWPPPVPRVRHPMPLPTALRLRTGRE